MLGIFFQRWGLGESGDDIEEDDERGDIIGSEETNLPLKIYLCYSHLCEFR